MLEARDRVGGRTLQPRGRAARVFDLGGQYVGPGQTRIAALADELGLKTAPTPHEGRKWIEIAGRPRASYAGEIPKLPLSALLQLQLAAHAPRPRWPRAAAGRALGRAARGLAGTRTRVESWWRRFTVGRSVRAMLRHTIRMTFGAEADEMSLLLAAPVRELGARPRAT